MLHLIDTPIKGTPVDKKAGRHGKQKGHNRAREKGNGASRHAIYAQLGHCLGPFLYTGATRAVFQSFGTVPVDKELL